MQMKRIIVCPLIKKVKTTLLAQLKQKACIFTSFKAITAAAIHQMMLE